MAMKETTTKVCSICKIEKTYEDFFNDKRAKSGKQSRCKQCDCKKAEKWRNQNLEYFNKYYKSKRNSDPLYKLTHNLRVRIGVYCKSIGIAKKTKTQQVIGIEPTGFKSYMESKFQDGMSWENYGQWHVDHIKPISLATTEQEIIELNHYTNLQPLWASENFKKSNRYEEAQHGNFGDSFL
jgi:hypothetical protein